MYYHNVYFKKFIITLNDLYHLIKKFMTNCLILLQPKNVKNNTKKHLLFTDNQNYVIGN